MAHFKVWSQRVDFARRESLCIFVRDDNGRESVAAPLVFTDCTETLIDKPTIDGSRPDLHGRAFLQACLDHAWEVGLRPAGYMGRTEEVAALKAHLDDMRRIALSMMGLPRIIAPVEMSESEALLRGHIVKDG